MSAPEGRALGIPTASDHEANARLIGNLMGRIRGALDALLSPDEPYALLDFPDHPNVGDSAIWLGTITYLRQRGMPPPRYTCSCHTFSEELLARRLPQGTILLSGGGNFGDLYPANQALRERVVGRFREHRVIQLPQSIHFENEASLERARAAFNAHPNVTLLARDRYSMELCRASFEATTALCPDMAFCLGPLARPRRISDEVIWLARSDKESAGGSVRQAPGVRRVEWLEDDPSISVALGRFLGRQLRHRPGLRPWLQSALSGTYERVARKRVARGCALLGRGRSVVTDRLHGHILALMIGVPHVVIDNSYGKVRRFHHDWTRTSPLARWAESEAEALALATAPIGAEREAG